jgi:hypothetical protein
MTVGSHVWGARDSVGGVIAHLHMARHPLASTHRPLASPTCIDFFAPLTVGPWSKNLPEETKSSPPNPVHETLANPMMGRGAGGAERRRRDARACGWSGSGAVRRGGGAAHAQAAGAAAARCGAAAAAAQAAGAAAARCGDGEVRGPRGDGARQPQAQAAGAAAARYRDGARRRWWPGARTTRGRREAAAATSDQPCGAPSRAQRAAVSPPRAGLLSLRRAQIVAALDGDEDDIPRYGLPSTSPHTPINVSSSSALTTGGPPATRREGSHHGFAVEDVVLAHALLLGILMLSF